MHAPRTRTTHGDILVTEVSVAIQSTSGSQRHHPVCLQGSGGDPGGAWAVQLWQRRNWHWHLLDERRWARCGDTATTRSPGVLAAWSEAHPCTVYTVTGAGALEATALAPSPDVSRLGTAAVIDGATVRLTPLRHSVMPPPLAAARVRVGAPVHAVAWGELECGREVLAAVDADGRISIVASGDADCWAETVEAHVTAAGDDTSVLECVADKWPPLEVPRRPCSGSVLRPRPAVCQIAAR
jgi:IKI3 family